MFELTFTLIVVAFEALINPLLPGSNNKVCYVSSATEMPHHNPASRSLLAFPLAENHIPPRLQNVRVQGLAIEPQVIADLLVAALPGAQELDLPLVGDHSEVEVVLVLIVRTAGDVGDLGRGLRLVQQDLSGLVNIDASYVMNAIADHDVSPALSQGQGLAVGGDLHDARVLGEPFVVVAVLERGREIDEAANVDEDRGRGTHDRADVDHEDVVDAGVFGQGDEADAGADGFGLDDKRLLGAEDL